MKNNHAVIICVESVFIEDLIVAFVSSKAFSRQRSGTKHNNFFVILNSIRAELNSDNVLSAVSFLVHPLDSCSLIVLFH